MAHVLRGQRDLLAVIARSKPALRKAILKELDRTTVTSLCEACHNILRGAVPLSKVTRTRLYKHKNTIRKLAQRGEGWKKKKETLRQSGGGVFLPILLSALSGIISSALTK